MSNLFYKFCQITILLYIDVSRGNVDHLVAKSADSLLVESLGHEKMRESEKGGDCNSGAWVGRHTYVATHGSSHQSHKISPPYSTSNLCEPRPLRGDNGGYKMRGEKFSVCEGFLSENHYTSSSDKYAERSRGGYSDNFSYNNRDTTYDNAFDLTSPIPVNCDSEKLSSYCDNRQFLKGTLFYFEA